MKISCAIWSIEVAVKAAILSATNDELICDFATLPLSGIRLNFTQPGFEATALLDSLMRGELQKNRPR